MKFITIYFSLLRNGEFLQLMKNILKIINQFDLTQLNLTNRINTFSTAVQALDNAFKPISGEELTSELKSLDTRRDRALMGIKQYLQSCLYREEENVVNAAGSLLEIYESHGKRIDKLPYQQQTAVTNALLKDFGSTPEQTENVKTVTLNQWVTLLEELNIAFDDTYVDRAKTVTEPAGIEEKREAIKTAYTNLEADIEAYARVAENKDAYKPLIQAINGLIDDYNQAAQNRFHGKAPVDDIKSETGIS